jgi:hypothetical protein
MWNISRKLIIATAIRPLFDPLTEQLKRLNTGYEEHIKKKKNAHLLYMVSLKLIAKSKEELQTDTNS